MITKRLVLICACWTLFTLMGGLIGVWKIHSRPIPGVPNELRAAKLGLSIGALTATGYAALWLSFALTARRKGLHRQEERNQSEDTGT